nr:retrovirus-related Pol polyprotein from transposon TNT 1-94 [Tanacetum cinerariifolium]
MLDRQALGVVRLSLAKNVAYNVVNEKTTYGLFKALSNMYDKPSASKKVFFIRKLVNTKMKEGASIADHVNEFNSILSRKTSEEYSNSLLSAKDKGMDIKQDKGQKQNRGGSSDTSEGSKNSGSFEDSRRSDEVDSEDRASFDEGGSETLQRLAKSWWLKNFLVELDRAQTECVLFCDNQIAIHLTKNPVFHGRTKHIKIIYHYIRELVSEGTLSLKKILGAKNPADMLTKVVTTEKLKLCAASTGLRDN